MSPIPVWSTRPPIRASWNLSGDLRSSQTKMTNAPEANKLGRIKFVEYLHTEPCTVYQERPKCLCVKLMLGKLLDEDRTAPSQDHLPVCSVTPPCCICCPVCTASIRRGSCSTW